MTNILVRNTENEMKWITLKINKSKKYSQGDSQIIMDQVRNTSRVMSNFYSCSYKRNEITNNIWIKKKSKTRLLTGTPNESEVK